MIKTPSALLSEALIDLNSGAYAKSYSTLFDLMTHLHLSKNKKMKRLWIPIVKSLMSRVAKNNLDSLGF